MRSFKYYLKAKLKLILILMMCITIFTGVFSLYDLPIEAILYGAGLSFFVILLFGIFDYRSFNFRVQALRKVQKDIEVSIENLPEGVNAIEDAYINLVKALFQQQNKLISKSREEMAEMIDYYTLWVHQIKTPIAAMALLLQGQDSKENKELKMQLFKIEQYVEMVLVYLRMNSESSDYVFKKCDLDRIVKQCVRKYASMFIKKKISIDLKPIDKMPITDEKWLAFVLEQILSNAIKYTNEGSVSIYMEGNNSLVIEDTGIGIAEEALYRIFDRGFTGYNGRMDKKASGLGMYLSKKILTNLGHDIKIESKIGEGTKVIVSFDESNDSYRFNE